ncbi:hypothetical protein ILUMI_24843 [Ignelater luminosus]|uniref:Uncharacterized protein n=1 Tax=Ignelater luminosus TaxID=2038154 RepID=A0A8K0C9P8_IGNLU|nr:hypothetical protein ILUMI_24843 [Ignelater luminosus]
MQNLKSQHKQNKSKEQPEKQNESKKRGNKESNRRGITLTITFALAKIIKLRLKEELDKTSGKHSSYGFKKDRSTKIKANETRAMLVAAMENSISLETKLIEHVAQLKYLGMVTESNGKLEREINEKTGKEIPKTAKTEVVKKVGCPVENSGHLQRNKSKINAMEIRFCRRIKNKTRKYGTKNEVIEHKGKTKQANQVKHG